MAWTSPSTWVAGAILTASQLNTQLRDNMTELAPFFAAWTSWTPVIKQSATVSITNNRSRYIKVGRLVIATFDVSCTSSGTASNAMVIEFGSIATAAAANSAYGSYRIFDTGITNYVGTLVAASTTAMNFYQDGNGNPLGFGQQFTSGDSLQGTFVYESAA
jgi:hypothetical protein